MQPLTASSVAGIPAADPPRYDRSTLTSGIAHIGVGNFHRAHQAMILDGLLRARLAADWSITGIGLLPGDARMRDALKEQDHLYTLTVRHPDGRHETRTIGSITDYRFLPDDPEGTLELLASPAIRILSMTITEGGYNIDRTTGVFDPSTPAVAADLTQAAPPTTAFGVITEALRRRRAAGVVPFTVLSCDNVQGNGHVARHAITAYARALDPDLADWIEREVHFPNSMVDRITPATTDADRADVADRLGLADAWPVACEPFFQWVLEDDFGDGRPPFEHSEVQLVDDVEPYELMKLRLLNASHQAMAYFGILGGHRYAHEAMADPALVALLRQYMALEARPTLKPVPGIDLDEYVDSLIERFSSTEVADTLARLATDASNRIPKFLLPVVRDNLASGGPIELSAAIVASWARYSEELDDAGAPIEPTDELRAELHEAAARQAADPLAFLRNRLVFGELVDDERFTAAYLATLGALREHGVLDTVRALVAQGGDGN